MVRHPLKATLTSLATATVLAFAAAGHAHAFTETQVPPPAAKSAPLAEQPTLQLDKLDDGNGLSLTTPNDGTSGGTELKIPGVGSIGTLPKLDFGLELLYGGGTDQGTDTTLEDKSDDVLIKGKIRHRF